MPSSAVLMQRVTQAGTNLAKRSGVLHEWGGGCRLSSWGGGWGREGFALVQQACAGTFRYQSSAHAGLRTLRNASSHYLSSAHPRPRPAPPTC